MFSFVRNPVIDCPFWKSFQEPNGTSTSAGGAMRLSGKEAAPGPVEALKQMLFTMQDMAHHETLDNEDSSYYKVTL